MSQLAFDTRKTDKVIFARRFALWMSLGTILMMFAGFTSAYIVKKADTASWTVFQIPSIFYVSTALIILSSVTLWLAHRSFKRGDLVQYRNLLTATLALGIGFVICQYLGWKDLVGQGIIMTEEISGAFFYVLSGVHLAHVAGGIIVLLVSLVAVVKKLKDPVYELTQEVSPMRKMRVEMVATYWHFVDFLWIYLFLFLLYNHY